MEQKGMNQYDWKDFTDLLIKANDEQLVMIAHMVLDENDRRIMISKQRVQP